MNYRPKELLLSSEATRLVTPPISVSSLRLAAQTGRLKMAARTPGGVMLFARVDIEAWNDERRKNTRRLGVAGRAGSLDEDRR